MFADQSIPIEIVSLFAQPTSLLCAKSFFSVLADLWRNVNGKLENKKYLLNWEFYDTPWTLPLTGVPGHIESVHPKGKIYALCAEKKLGVRRVIIADKKDIDSQLWIVEDYNKGGWFTIRNMSTNRLLSAESESRTNTGDFVGAKRNKTKFKLSLRPQ